jgi:tetraacyldisaccharide 4'-kinase
VGGTGKTPLVILLARLLANMGRCPAVLSRGYGGRSKAPVNIVSDGNRIFSAWREAGDEPVLIARLLPGIPVLTGKKRLATGQAAVERFGADVLILDDAFQHRQLCRNLDIVLVDAGRPFGNGALLPRGELRERPEALRRAHLVVRTGSGGGAGDGIGGIFGLPSFSGVHRPLELVGAGEGNTLPLAELQGRRILAFAGIGRPESFRKSLVGLGAEVVSFRAFTDHQPYGPGDIEALGRLASESGAELIVTTEKDGVRLADFPDFLTRVLCLRIGMEVDPAGEFAELIFSRVAY